MGVRVIESHLKSDAPGWARVSTATPRGRRPLKPICNHITLYCTSHSLPQVISAATPGHLPVIPLVYHMPTPRLTLYSAGRM